MMRSWQNDPLTQIGFHLVASGLTWRPGDPERQATACYKLHDVKKLFLKLA
ncbi:MAG TPA: hypothetical protein VL068_00110 [Microthrixaceae bacterium]|nr:hypothetical protein [Microthrixaceae bacterium]